MNNAQTKRGRDEKRALDQLLEFLSRYPLLLVPERDFQSWLQSQYEPNPKLIN